MDYIKKNSGFLFVLFISLLPLANLIKPGLPITHDGIDHVARIASFYSSMNEGNIIPRWSGNLNWGYGHPIFMFLYPLPSYFASFFHFIDITYVNSLKLVFAISYSLSGIFMYIWLKKFLSSNAAIVGATLYLFAPYRFVDIYVRGAIGEHVSFVFLPLVLLALLNLFESNKTKLRYAYLNFIFVSISFSFLILSHNAISLLFIPFVIFYVLYLFFENKSRQKLLLSIISLGFGLLYSFFFWFPAFIEGKYTLRDIVTNNAYLDRFVEIRGLIYGPWNYGGTGQFTTQLGIISISLIILSIIFMFKFYKSKDNQKYLLFGSLVFFFGSIFLMLPQSNFIWNQITILQKLQFPWRFLTITTFCASLIGAILIDKINLKKKNILVIIIISLTIIPTISYWHGNKYVIYADSDFEKPYASTTDTGESSPIWSVRSMDGFPKSNIEIIEGKAEIVNYKRTSTYHEYLINAKEKTRLRENTLYFPGWKIYDNYKLVENVQFQDPKNRGVMTFYLDEGLHDLILKFEDTKIREFSNYISLFSIIFVLLIPMALIIFSDTRFKKNKW